MLTGISTLPDGAIYNGEMSKQGSASDVFNGTNSTTTSSHSAGDTMSQQGGMDNQEATQAIQASANGSSDFDKWLDYMTSARDADYAYNHQEAEINRQWQEMMSNSAYQRMVNDLQAAGLNPWLALQGSGLGGASTGSGATASSNAASSSAGSYLDYKVKNKATNIALLKTLIGGITSAVGIYQNGMDKVFSVLGSVAKFVLPFAK